MFSRLDPDLNRNRRWYLGLFLALFFAGSMGRAWTRPFWYDELFTLVLGGLPSVGDLWTALASGMEQNPPLYLLVNRAVGSLAGQGHIAMRLLSMAGVAVFLLSLYSFVRRTGGETAGWVALLTASFTETFGYAWEARPYGFLLGFCGLSLVCWQRAARAGMTLSLAAAASSHFYAALLWIPLSVGEIVRWRKSGRFDRGVWLSMAAGAAPLALFLPLMRGAGSYSAAFWAAPSPLSLLTFWEYLLAPLALPLVAALLVAALSSARDAGTQPPPVWETAAAAAFCAVPAAALILALTLTNAYSDRYALPAAAGVALLIAFVSSRLRVAGALFVALFSLFVLRQLGSAMLLFTAPPDPVQAHRLLDRPDLPVAVANGVLYLQLAWYAPPELGARLHYLADPEAARLHTGSDSVDRALTELRRWRKLNITDRAAFLARHDRFLVYLSEDGADGARFQWLPDRLRHDKVVLTVVARDRGRMLLEAQSADGR